MEPKNPPLISLCIIAGNEAAHIGRLLDSFAGAFDELSFVRAVGATQPDETWTLAAAWCRKNNKDFRGAEYLNATPGIPHVDNFAAARNLSFEQASHEWLLWADCDDVLSDASAVRREVAHAGALMLRFPYRIPAAGKVTMRERAITAAAFRDGSRWRFPVHENIVLQPGATHRDCAAPEWIHAPDGPKAGGERRNLRILTAALKEAPEHYFYCHQENFYLRNPKAAQRFGEIFLSLPGGNEAMRYQCLLNLCELAELKEEAATYALRAHHLFPKQKEAMACLVKCSFQEEHATRALVWSERLFYAAPVALSERLWCYEPKWDGWGAADLRARALRYAGAEQNARTTEEKMRNWVTPKISLLHATRGRHNRAIQCRDMWLDTADQPELVEHIFGIDREDTETFRWLRSFRHGFGERPDCVSAWNAAASMSTGGLLVQLSDDWLPFRGWDTALLKACGEKNPRLEPFALWVSDGQRTDSLMCMAVCSRARFKQQGNVLFAPEYEGVYSDNEYTHRAHRDGVVIDARHLVFKHLHPAFGHGEMDDTYRRQNAPEKYARGQEIFNRRNPEAAQ